MLRAPRSPLLAVVTLLLLSFDAAAAADAPSRVFRYATPTMGTIGTVSLVGTDSLTSLPAARGALEAFTAVDARLSNWDRASELSGVNVGLAVGPVRLSSEAETVISAALALAAESGGAFDPTVEPLVRLWGFLGGEPRVPPAAAIEETRSAVGHEHLSMENGVLRSTLPSLRIDLGGIAKGHAVDRALERLRAEGVTSALVDLSGNMRALGTPPGRPTWTVGLRDPDSENTAFATLTLGDDAVATSGNYEQFVAAEGRRYGHVLDPRTGWPVEGVDAVTVLADDALLADGWATALLVLGIGPGTGLATARDDLAAVFVQSAREGRRTVWVESSLRGRFELVAGASDRFDVRWF